MHFIKKGANNEKWLLVVKQNMTACEKKKGKFSFFHVSIFIPQPSVLYQKYSTDISI